MCGILGVINRDGGDLRTGSRDIVSMRDTMEARGPDNAGLAIARNFALAHRRLAIRDLDADPQPSFSQDGRFAIVFNGEIYNDAEIRKQLEQRGTVFHTSCDTEVLVEAWSAWGEACIEKLRGMFAFGVVNRETAECWIVRDRTGVKPLFYAEVENELIFASSIAAIRKHPRVSNEPNFSAIRHYLQTLRLTVGRETVFKKIYSVRPAEIIRIQQSRSLHHRIYWELPTSADENISFEDATDRLQSVIEESVKLRLKSDVPVGMMMSGGVDSNTLASLAQKNHGQRFVGVCGGGVDSEVAEQGGDFTFAHDCAMEMGISYSETRVQDDKYLDTWKQLISHYETPLSTPTDAIIFHVARELKQSVGVAIGGEGADEAFCGYTIPHWSGKDLERSFAPAAAGNHNLDARASLLRQYGRDKFASASDHYLTANGLIPKPAQQQLFQSEHFSVEDNATEQYYEQLFDQKGDLSMTEKYARVLFQVNLESLLGRLDSATMAHGLEARVPFTDHVLVEHAFRTPLNFRIDVSPEEKKPWLSSLELAQRGSIRSKRILRAIASRLMPERLAMRPKMSFPTPLPTWLHNNWKSWITEKFNSSSFAKEVFQPDALKQLDNLPPHLALWKWPVLNTILWGDNCFG
ncbi:MAG: asparagine synthase (glutamine-hydrolyzing) [Mariniblastus sp.]